MAKENYQIDFLISDEKINRYGYRILTDGIDTSAFEKNPVGFYNHETYTPPIGKWVKIWKENGQLKGTLEFDSEDEFAMKLYKKALKGFINSVSLHITTVSESNAEIDLLPGQKYPTVTKSQLLEVSLVNIPGNANAIKLFAPNGSELKLNLITQIMDKKDEKTVEQLQIQLDAQRKLNAENLVLRHKERGVVQEGEVESLQTLAFDNYETVSKMLTARTAPEKPAKSESTTEMAEAKALTLVDLHFDRGAITEAEKNIFKQSAMLDYEGTKKILEGKQGKEHLADFVRQLAANGRQNADDRAGWTYYDYFKKDTAALSAMEKEEPERYKKLVADFENESKKLGVG